jgi:hypothetical protein
VIDTARRPAPDRTMDLVSILNDNAGQIARFAKAQFTVWIAVLRNPFDVISKLDLGTTAAFMPALRLVVFVYALTICVAFPRMFLFGGVDVSSWLVVAADFVLTILIFCLVGLTLYAAGKLLGGRGHLLDSMIAGFYLTSLWPIIQATDYVRAPKMAVLDAHEMAVVRWALFIAVAVFVVVFIAVKVIPVMAYIHRFGRLRATAAVLIQELLMFVAIYMFLSEYFGKLGDHE